MRSAMLISSSLILCLAGGCVVERPRREVIVDRGPGPVVVEEDANYAPAPAERIEIVPVAPFVGAVWIRGHWFRNHHRHEWVWVGGHWR